MGWKIAIHSPGVKAVVDIVKNAPAIIEGHTKVMAASIGLTSEETEILAKERLSICKLCILYENNSCSKSKTIMNIDTMEEVNGCGCNLEAKVRVSSMSCPAGKWKAK